MKAGFIYIMTNKNDTTLYTGVTSDLYSRILKHKEKLYQLSFTAKYNLHKLVYWESFQEIGDAIYREKQIKAGSRQKKIDLILSMNPEWKDLTDEIKDIFTDY
ncbi:GIY-YIG nuclease family protein [Chryseobacterium sp. ISL-6]|uniref:GIY-YIG nuclease family protein n=1 Tax=Chryseobacterium sp. ISL-6 TaxID=2819143 RepID=UPI001BE57CFE|nr:GIY-YIG nuclease family protein [Chryseobacterium sp. ISL-6]MBT2416250.1 GIY-YIG nuclease family protein [Streptomyces sp. ISL-12]MBT2622789.1 GIY-YIG nuclease family protein [Chryseobacterium sp. ISL-6]